MTQAGIALCELTVLNEFYARLTLLPKEKYSFGKSAVGFGLALLMLIFARSNPTYDVIDAVFGRSISAGFLPAQQTVLQEL